MGAVKLCMHQIAEHPYYAEATGIHLYSMEELAYYLYHNIYLIDESIIAEPLYVWIDKELGVSALAQMLREGKNSGNHLYNQVMSILQAAEYHTAEELLQLSEKIKRISDLQMQERMKYKADELLQNGNYWMAVMEYDRILSIRQNSRLSVEFYAKVWNNLGVCYAKLFLFDQAALCFVNAYRFQKLPEYQQRAYYARKLSKEEDGDTESFLNLKLSEEFTLDADRFLEQLKKKSEGKCQEMNVEQFILEQKTKYSRRHTE